MKQYIIKPEYKGLIISKKVFIINANVTLDTTKFLTQDELASYYKLDEFKDIIVFEDVIPHYQITPDENTGVEEITFVTTEDPDHMFVTFDNDTTEKTTIKYNGIEQPKRKPRKKKS